MNTEYRNFFSMGTRLDAVFINVDSARVDLLAGGIKNDLDRIEATLSIYRKDSELSVLNATAYEKDIVVSPFLFETIRSCLDYYKLTGGVFDAGKGKLTGFAQRKDRREKANADSLIEQSGMKLVEINEHKRSVRYHGKNVLIDPGGFGKGLAMRDIKTVMLSEGIDNALVSFGESTVLAMGTHPHGKHWPIAVTDIYNKQAIVRLARLSDNCLSTSGTGFVDEGGVFRSSGNIIDPLTGESMDEALTVSLISDDPLEAEVLSTALLIDFDCLPDDFDRTGREAFAVIYDKGKNFVVKEIF
ncbi:MAG: FAD:protein FMN transferase [Bacteroidota bacterium]